MVRHFFSLLFLLLSLLLLLLSLLSLLLLFLLLPLFLFLLLFALLSVCSFALQHLPILFNQSPVPFSVGSSTTRIPFDGEVALHTACKNTCEDDIACLWDGYWSGTQAWRSSAVGQSECTRAELVIKAICLNASHGGNIASSSSAGRHRSFDDFKRGKWTIQK